MIRRFLAGTVFFGIMGALVGVAYRSQEMVVGCVVWVVVSTGILAMTAPRD